MKTIHRIMYENLPARQYKNFCASIEPEAVVRLTGAGALDPKRILKAAFIWNSSVVEGVEYSQRWAYWRDALEMMALRRMEKCQKWV